MTESPNLNHYVFTSCEDDQGQRLDKFIVSQLDCYTRSRIKSFIDNGQVVVNGEVITASSYIVKSEDVVSITIPPSIDPSMQPADIPLEIAFEDAHMLVVNKQAGLTVHPGAGCHQDTMANALLAHCGDSLSGIGGVSRPGIVHRLDKDTSGLLVVAKTDRAHHALSSQIASRELKRIYYAIVWGVPSPASGTLTGNIDRSKKDRTKMAIVKTGGKEAITHYRVEEIFGEGMASLVACKLQTGRTHQIRLHFNNFHHPLIGDQSYGTSKPPKLHQATEALQEYLQQFKRQALHSHKIGFHHPETGEYMEYTAPLPDDMKKLVELLRMQS
jgi:23S rRNA pseudouridine1911/1915/1917 synthase